MKTTPDPSPVERWLPIPSYEGWYEVSDLGNVRSWKGRRDQSTGVLRRRAEPRALTPVMGSAGYLQISLCGDQMKTWKIHRLVAITFLGQRPNGLEIAHANSDKLDNRLSNLRYATHAENLQDDVRNGVKVIHYGGSGRPKLDANAVRSIKNCATSASVLAKTHDVSRETIRKIRAGQTWANV